MPFSVSTRVARELNRNSYSRLDLTATSMSKRWWNRFDHRVAKENISSALLSWFAMMMRKSGCKTTIVNPYFVGEQNLSMLSSLLNQKTLINNSLAAELIMEYIFWLLSIGGRVEYDWAAIDITNFVIVIRAK